MRKAIGRRLLDGLCVFVGMFNNSLLREKYQKKWLKTKENPSIKTRVFRVQCEISLDFCNHIIALSYWCVKFLLLVPFQAKDSSKWAKMSRWWPTGAFFGVLLSILLSFVNSVAQDNRFVKFLLCLPIPSAWMETSPNARDKCFNFRFRREKLQNVQKT